MEKNVGFKVLSFRGIPVYLKPSWFILMTIVIFGYAILLFQQGSFAMVDALKVSSSLAILIALGVLVHEMAHAVVGLVRGQKVLLISLTLWGGVTKLTPGCAPSSLMVSLAGPLVNLLYAALLWLVAGVLGPSAWGVGFLLAAYANLVISLFNLIPAYPLDGGHALEALVSILSGLRSQGVRWTAWTTLMVIPLLITGFIARGLADSLLNVAILVLVCSYLWSAGYPALTSVSSQAKSQDNLRVASLRDPVFFVAPTSSLVDVASVWDGRTPLVVGDSAGTSGWLRVEDMNQLIAGANMQSPIADYAWALPQEGISSRGLRLDTIDFFNGPAYMRLPAAFREGKIPLAYPVLEGGAVVGILDHRKIAARLYAESSYLRQNDPSSQVQ